MPEGRQGAACLLGRAGAGRRAPVRSRCGDPELRRQVRLADPPRHPVLGQRWRRRLARPARLARRARLARLPGRPGCPAGPGCAAGPVGRLARRRSARSAGPATGPAPLPSGVVRALAARGCRWPRCRAGAATAWRPAADQVAVRLLRAGRGARSDGFGQDNQITRDQHDGRHAAVWRLAQRHGDTVPPGKLAATKSPSRSEPDMSNSGGSARLALTAASSAAAHARPAILDVDGVAVRDQGADDADLGVGRREDRRVLQPTRPAGG